MVFSEPHFIKRNKDIGAKTQEKEDVGNGKSNHKMVAYISDEPWGCQVQDNTHKRDAINRNL